LAGPLPEPGLQLPRVRPRPRRRRDGPGVGLALLRRRLRAYGRGAPPRAAAPGGAGPHVLAACRHAGRLGGPRSGAADAGLAAAPGRCAPVRLGGTGTAAGRRARRHRRRGRGPGMTTTARAVVLAGVLGAVAGGIALAAWLYASVT